MKKDLLAYLALAAICLIWGTTYLALRVAVVGFPPFLFVVIRQIIAGGILVALMLTVGKSKLPAPGEILKQAIGGFFMLSMGNGLVAYAEVTIPSGIAAIICSMMPMWVILINLTINRDERPTLPIMIGAALGFSGIILIFIQDLEALSNTAYSLGIFLTFLATISWASASIWLKKRKSTSDPFMNAGLQMFFAGVWLIPFTLVFDDLSNVTWSSNTVYAMIYLIAVGSIIAYGCYTYALKKLPMTIVSLYAYVNPLVAVALGWLILDEQLNARIGVAFLLTVAGIYLVNRGYMLRNSFKTQLSR
ncbi:EamA family transporter [Chryseolinea sp. T2]|uniref:DMT family transporter n=1 Tax=Chryseolinea sp. T2 TaxID=3129255 RepID=UPI0030787219